MKKYLPLVIIVVVLVGAIGAGAVLLRARKAEQHFETPQGTASNTPAPTLKVATFSVTLEEYGDYQCPPCGSLHPELKKIKEEYGERLRIVFRNLPLTKIHANALAAAQAAEAAGLQGRFWEMHDRLYESQKSWEHDPDPRPAFLKLAHEIGLDLDRFASDLDGKVVQERLAADQHSAESMGVEATPTIFIEGKQLRAEVTTPEGIRKGIDLMLAKKQQ